MKMKKLVIPCLAVMFSVGCASQAELTNPEIMARYDSLARLEQSFKMTEAADTQSLAPMHYKKAKKALDQATEMARDGDKGVEEKALEGIAQLNKAKEKAATARDMLEDVLMAKQRAVEVGAPNSLAEEFEDANDELLELTQALEKGNTEVVREDRMQLAKTFKSIELKALKKDIVETARKSLEKADKVKADKYAPKTYSQAKEEMRLALNVLEVNRGDKSEAEKYAERAHWWSERAIAITEVVQTFNQGDYTEEDIVLWYQDQLAAAVAPIDSKLPLHLDNKRLTTQVRTDINNLVSENQMLKSNLQQMAASKSQMESMTQQEKMALQQQLSQSKQQASESDRKFASIQEMFDEKEAMVFRQKQDILLRTSGFDFVSGKSEINSNNFALLQKIIKAIDEYPTSQVVVSGHTDAVGSSDLNMKLSADRAQTVADFLVKIGKIDESRIKAEGMGESKPVASNDTKDGRSENRRVEITIVN